MNVKPKNYEWGVLRSGDRSHAAFVLHAFDRAPVQGHTHDDPTLDERGARDLERRKRPHPVSLGRAQAARHRCHGAPLLRWRERRAAVVLRESHAARPRPVHVDLAARRDTARPERVSPCRGRRPQGGGRVDGRAGPARPRACCRGQRINTVRYRPILVIGGFDRPARWPQWPPRATVPLPSKVCVVTSLPDDSVRTYATRAQICESLIRPPHDGMPSGRPSAIDS